MKRFVLLVAIIMCTILTGCQLIEKEEKINVNAEVTDMQYERSYVTKRPMKMGETYTYVSQRHPARYLVTISYEDVSETFNDENLYESVKEGDTIQMILYKGYDKNDNLIKQTLQFPEQP
jgi:hypothetical protein